MRLLLPLLVVLLGATTSVAQTVPPPARMPLTVAAETEAEAPRERVLRVQRRLKALGYDPGPLDGIIGPRTRRAVRAWQVDHGLEPTGQPSQALLRRLTAEAAPSPAAAPLTDHEHRLREAGRLRPYVLGVQAELREQGFFVGPLADAITPHLRQAIRAYQRQAGLEPTGEVSQALLDHLRFARPEVRAARSE